MMMKINRFEDELLIKQVSKLSGIHEFFIKNGILTNQELVRLIRAYAVIYERIERLIENSKEPNQINQMLFPKCFK
jgi:hypothetical protein